MITNTLRSDVQAAELPKVQANISITSKVRQFLKRNAFNLHRWISIVALVPVLFWSLSGAMHPFMAHWFKPPIAKEFLPPRPIDQSQVLIPLREALLANGMMEIHSFRLVSFQGSVWYQIEQIGNPERLYLETRTGTRLVNGDRMYAEFLAKQYVGNEQGNILESRMVTSFDGDYAYVNRLLPVWKISFKEGGYDVYIETSSGRMATYTTPARRFFQTVFKNFHTMSWLNDVETLRRIIMASILSIIVLTAFSGLVMYALLWKRRKTSPAKGLRKYHRGIGIAVSLSTLTFAVSGMYHALHKDRLRDEMGQARIQARFRAEELNFGAKEAAFVAPPMFDVTPVRMSNTVMYRFAHSIVPSAADECCAPQQPMKNEMKAESKAEKSDKSGDKIKVASYFNAATGKAVPQGDSKYARYLAEQLSGINTATITSERLQTEFQGEYGFINKRLPVQRLETATSNKRTVYVETASGTIAADVNNSDRLEGFTFAYIHKFEFLKTLGKNVRDGVAVGLASMNAVVALLGLALFLRLPKK